MRVAVARQDIIENVIETPTLAKAAQIFPGAELIKVVNDAPAIGWLRVEGGWAAPVVEPIPLVMTHLQFVEHVQVAGDMTDADLVAAKADPLLAAFWIKFELASNLERDNQTTVQGLAALVATGYLTEAERDAVVDLWPVT